MADYGLVNSMERPLCESGVFFIRMNRAPDTCKKQRNGQLDVVLIDKASTQRGGEGLKRSLKHVATSSKDEQQ